MNENMYMLSELQADLLMVPFWLQITAILAALLLARSLGSMLNRNLQKNTKEDWQHAAEAVQRVLFPISALVILSLETLVLKHWQHVSLMRLVSTLLLAMAIIRLLVYALRYVFAPSKWVVSVEKAIASTIWVLFLLEMLGWLGDLTDWLDGISLHVGLYKLTMLQLLQACITVIVTLIASLWLSRMIENRVMASEQINPNMRVVISKLVRMLLVFVALMLAFSAIGLDITMLSVFGGALGVGLGFGLQKIASNFVSGFILLLDDSLRMGDLITVDQHHGVVSSLRARYLVLRKLDDTEVIIPNETLISTPVINHSYFEKRGGVQIPLRVAQESDLDKVIEMVLDCTKGFDRIMTTPAPEVLVKGFGESGIELSLSFSVPDPERGTAKLQSEMYLTIWRSFQANGVRLPIPRRDISLQSIPVTLTSPLN